MLELYYLVAQGVTQDGGQGASEGGGGIASLFSSQYFLAIFMVGFLIFFYFAIIRPQNKKRKEMEVMLKNIKKGDKVISIGGVHGKVMAVKDGEVIVKIDDNATITFDKSAISRVVDKQQEKKKKDDADKNNNDDNK